MKEEYEEVIFTVEEICAPPFTFQDDSLSSEKCRACAERLPDVKYDLLETPTLMEQFERISTTRLDHNDSLPKSICPLCHERLQEADNFQKSCIESYRALLAQTANNHPIIQEPEPSATIAVASSDESEKDSDEKFQVITIVDVQPEFIEKDNVKTKYSESDAIQSVNTENVNENVQTMIIVEEFNDNCQISENELIETVVETSSPTEHFSQQQNHLEDSTKLPSYMCDMCGSSFSSSIQLRRHKLLHLTRITKNFRPTAEMIEKNRKISNKSSKKKNIVRKAILKKTS